LANLSVVSRGVSTVDWRRFPMADRKEALDVLIDLGVSAAEARNASAALICQFTVIECLNVIYMFIVTDKYVF